MIDICFSGSFSGFLRLVKKEIKSDEIFPIYLNLNYGNLDCNIIEEQVKREVETLTYYKNITYEELQLEYESGLEEAYKKQERLSKYLSEGRKIRLWVSNHAGDRCGLYWFCNLIKDYENEVAVVLCPGYEYDDVKDVIMENRKWEMFNNPYFVAEFAHKSHVLSKGEIFAYAKTWENLVGENYPLRILLDDTIIGVEETFFDNVILSFVSSEPKSQKNIIGETMGKLQGGCDVAFVSKRIEYLLEARKIKVVEGKVDEDDCYWTRMISLC